MMKKKYLWLAGLIIMLMPNNVHAANLMPECNTVITENVQQIQPRADQIIVKYRDNNGKLQYRRWNATKQCWVDSQWIDI